MSFYLVKKSVKIFLWTPKDHESRACAFRKLVFDWLIPAPNLHLVGSTGPDIPSIEYTVHFYHGISRGFCTFIFFPEPRISEYWELFLFLRFSLFSSILLVASETFSGKHLTFSCLVQINTWNKGPVEWNSQGNLKSANQ